MLRVAAAASPQNAELWHDLGVLLSAWIKPYWRKGSMPSNVVPRFVIADSALARAMRLAPDSATYAIDYGDHLYNTNAWNLVRANAIQADAVDRAERTGDTLSLTQSADALGLFLWRRYETLSSRRFEISALGLSVSDFAGSPWKSHQMFDDATRPWRPPLGEGLYVEAERAFAKARSASVDNELAFRHAAMLLAQRNRWEELASMAAERVKQRPAQLWPWLSLALAEQRRGRSTAADVAFDSAMSRIPAEERARLFSLNRLLPTGREKFFDTLSVAARSQLTDVYWSLATPTLLTENAIVENEFRARVAYSELMWTNEQMQVHGVDSDRGEVLVRWGPPDEEWTVKEGLTSVAQVWWLYRATGMIFLFNATATYGTATINQDFRTFILEPNKQKRPALWNNLPAYRNGIDSLPAQIARFRGTTDSIDVAAFGALRLGTLHRGAPTDTSLLKTGVFAVDGRGKVRQSQVNTERNAVRDTNVIDARSWSTRVPTSTALLRIEAYDEDANRIARAIRETGSFRTSGFGVSDLLIGSTIEPIAGRARTRWRDFAISPIAGNVFQAGKPLDLLWEVYEPAVLSGKSSFRVTLTVQRVEPTGLTGIATKIVGGIKDAVLRTSTTNRVSVQYDRTTDPQPISVETLRLDLGTARPGRYQLTLVVTDLHANTSVTSTQPFVLESR